MVQTMKLPRILIIDDQYGRCGLGPAFETHVGPEIFSAFKSDRRALCANFGLVDVTGDVRTAAAPDPIARAVFCPAQTWKAQENRIENDVALALDLVGRGWPFPDGDRWALILLDLRFTYGELNVFGDPEKGSLLGLDDLLPRLVQTYGPDLPVIVLSSTARKDNNARARTLGALDFIQRLPGVGAPEEACRKSLQDALFQHGLMPDPLGKVVGRSLAVMKMLRSARRAARSARTVLIQGETGTGKGLLARYIHAVSVRKHKPFVVFNGSQRPGDLQADELFGHWKGAFTDARDDRPGIWERANGGTVFIDEVADLDQAVQGRLMEPIEERRIRRMGHPPQGTEVELAVDVQVLLATNRDLYAQASTKGDFLNRIHAFEIRMPSLRDRREDVPKLALHLAGQIAPAWGGTFLPETLEALSRHDWTHGNVRELRNVIERALTAFPDQDITVQDLGLTPAAPRPAHRGTPAPDGHLADWPSAPAGWHLDPVIPRPLTPAITLLDMVAEAILRSVEASRERGRTNYTAAVRMLSGNPELSTTDAKRFLRRLLTLDRPRGGILRIVQAGLSPEDGAFFSRLLQPSGPVDDGPERGPR
jgi:two-component system, NtrC family, response regulator PilR